MAGLRVTVVKPVKPLRYRLAPIEEKLDNHDKLEKEFEQALKSGKIPEEQADDYRLYLTTQRDKLQGSKDRAQGIKPTVEKVMIDRTGDKIPNQWGQYLTDVNPQKAFKWCLFIAVALWFYCKNN